MAILRFASLCFLSSLAWAQTEQLVNVSRDSSQRAPRIARAADGRMLVVWQSYHQFTDPDRPRIMMRWLAPDGSPDGAESAVAAPTRSVTSWRYRHHGAQEQPDVAVNASGLGAITWVEYDSTSSWRVRLRLIRSGIVDVPVGSLEEANEIAQSHPSVDISENGVVVLAWDSWDTLLTHRSVWIRYFDSTGTPLGPKFRPHDETGVSQQRPVVRMRPDSIALVVWETWTPEIQFWEVGNPDPANFGSGTGVVGTIVRPTGPLRPPHLLNTTWADYQWLADVEMAEDEGFYVVWCSWEQDGEDGAIIGVRLTSEGLPAGGEVVLNATTRHYQWLPRIARRPHGYLVTWSSWASDGDREGVSAVLIDPHGRRQSFEMGINQRTPSFQWEPDAVVVDDTTAVVVWSDWQGEGEDYDVVARRVVFEVPAGVLSKGIPNAGGRSTAMFVPHVIDTTLLTGHTYEAAVLAVVGDTVEIRVTDITTSEIVLDSFRMDRGEGVQYLTPPFDGIRLEIVPEFDLALDLSRSGLSSSTVNVTPLNVNLPTAGTVKLAPVDMTLLWGSRDTVSTGAYVAPLDTAINVSGQRVVQTPFRAWNITDGSAVELLVIDTNANGRWDRGERIILRTPVAYRTSATNTHAELSPTLVAGSLPAPGDVFYVYTQRPMTVSDRYRFTAESGLVVGVESAPFVPLTMRLDQNYPNPFNPRTTIMFELDRTAHVLLEVYDVQGRKVEVLARGEVAAGRHLAGFDGRGRSSGVYFAVLRSGGMSVVRKMVLLR